MLFITVVAVHHTTVDDSINKKLSRLDYDYLNIFEGFYNHAVFGYEDAPYFLFRMRALLNCPDTKVLNYKELTSFAIFNTVRSKVQQWKYLPSVREILLRMEISYGIRKGYVAKVKELLRGMNVVPQSLLNEAVTYKRLSIASHLLGMTQWSSDETSDLESDGDKKIVPSTNEMDVVIMKTLPKIHTSKEESI